MEISTEIVGQFDTYSIKILKSQSEPDYETEIVYIAEDGTVRDLPIVIDHRDIEGVIELLHKYGVDNGFITPTPPKDET